MLVTDDYARLLLELFYTDEKKFKDIEWTNVTLSNISNSDMLHLTKIARTLKTKRLEKVGKMSRNASCPCGIGKKYKKCCL